MSLPDLNLLVTLDVLLAEGSVAGAARRLQLSPSAMSRALARLRVTTGDPLLVRAGRDLVPTPRALELRDEVARLVEGAGAVLRPSRPLDPRQIDRTFALRTREGFVETFGPALLARLDDEAPGLRLRASNQVELRLNPGISISRNPWQYVDEINEGANVDYVFGTLNQITTSLTARVSYTVTDDAVTIEHRAETDAPTVVSLTNHTYFNLAGGGTVDVPAGMAIFPKEIFRPSRRWAEHAPERTTSSPNRPEAARHIW